MRSRKIASTRQSRPHVRHLRHFLPGILLCWAALARGADSDLAARVVLLANSADPDSLRVAQHYAAARGVPAANIIALPMPLAETITWREFVATIWQPLEDELLRTKWIDAIPMALTDAVGRRKIDVHSHRLAALVVCRGVPLAIAHDPALYAESLPFTANTAFRTNAGAVDSELSLLAHPNYPINAFVPNPLFQNDHVSVFDREKVIEVARLDGPTVEDALALVDRALAAEKTGLLGRAYVDLGGIHPDGDRWLEAVVKQLESLGFDTDVERTPATFAASARMDAPVLYFGWYTGDLNGPFALPGFQFPPGAVAMHIHSYSARTLHSASAGWSGPLVARGATATVGNVFEPYLQLTHHPDLLLRALARGATLADAAYYALPALSWQAILIGDPLYRPFAVPFDQQWKNLAQLPPRLAGYAALRRMHQLDAANRHDEATAFAQLAQREAPSLAVGVALARRLQDAGDADSAVRALGFAPLLKSFPTDQWALAREAALLLETAGRPALAVEVWRNLFNDGAVPRELRVSWLPDAKKSALAARDVAQAEAWQKAFLELTAPPLTPGKK
jgi:uncharacterized protein (TIGR03790 family)